MNWKKRTNPGWRWQLIGRKGKINKVEIADIHFLPSSLSRELCYLFYHPCLPGRDGTLWLREPTRICPSLLLARATRKGDTHTRNRRYWNMIRTHLNDTAFREGESKTRGIWQLRNWNDPVSPARKWKAQSYNWWVLHFSIYLNEQTKILPYNSSTQLFSLGRPPIGFLTCRMLKIINLRCSPL